MLVTLPRMVGNYQCEQLPPVVEAIEDLVGGGYWSYVPKRMAFLKWARLTYFGLKRAVLTHEVYKPQILLRMTSRLFKVSAGASRGWTKYVLRDLCSYSMGIRNVIGTH
jgi:hypothetical protein